MTKEMVNEFLAKCRVFYIATVDENNQARVRPFGAHLYVNGELYFMTQKMGNKVYGQMKAHPQVEICGFCGREWIRLNGEVTFVENPELAKQFISSAPMGAQKRFEDPRYMEQICAATIPFKLNKAVVTVSSFNGPSAVYPLDEQ